MNFEADMRAALQTFIVESLELLQTMEDDLLSIEEDEEPSERINAIFRAAHTIKGSAGVFSLHHIVAFTHVVESLLDALRDGKLSVSADLVAALLPCCDHIALLIRRVVDGHSDEDSVLSTVGQQLHEALYPFFNSETDKGVIAVTGKQNPVENMGGGIIQKINTMHG